MLTRTCAQRAEETLQRHPFARRPPPEALLRHRGFEEARKRLRFTVDLDGIAVLTSDPGCGKSLLLGEVADELQEIVRSDTRATGTTQLQSLLDRRDPVFGGTFSLETPNSALSVGTSYAGFEEKLRGPCRSAPIEEELTSDILYHREATCEASASTCFELCCRYYRAYLLAAVSIVEAFLNRYALLLLFRGGDPSAVRRMQGAKPLEERVGAWVDLVAAKSVSDVNKGKEWSDFSKLRKARNGIVHGDRPFFSHHLPELVRSLNFVQAGVGGLLRLLRATAGEPTLAFIERLRTAPNAHFVRSPTHP